MAMKEANGSVADRATRAAHEAVDQLGARGKQAEERLRDSTQQASERSREYTDQVNAYVRDNPLTSVGIAVAAGFVLGALLRR